jgi:hypothetical protein
MNLFTDHDYGNFADDGFGNLIRLERGPLWRGIGYFFDYGDSADGVPNY